MQAHLHIERAHAMKTRIRPIASLFACFLVLLTAWPGGAEEAPKFKPNIYDESVDGAKQIADALVTAKNERKHVLLQFGANWCDWCHTLHILFQTDKNVSEKLKSNYVFVLIDVNKENNKETNAKYGRPTQFGIPVLVVLDADGKQLTTQETGSLEEGDHHSPEKVLAFLEKWAPTK